MARFIDPLIHYNLVDANILDDVADGQDAAVQELLRLLREEQLTVLLPYSVKEELNHPNTPAHVRRAADMFLFTIKVELTPNELRMYRQLVDAAKGDAAEKNIVRDLLHVFEAAKYGGYFITRDKRLLARRALVPAGLQVEVVTPQEFVDRVAQAKERARRYAR